MVSLGAALTFICCLAANVTAETNLPSEISGSTTLTLGGSPYIARDDVHVLTGSSLVIDPGVTLKFVSGRRLHVNGTLKVDGTASQQVTFTLLNEFSIVDEFENATHPNIKWYDDSKIDRGTLLAHRGNDKWLGICDTRVGDLNRYRAWADNIAKVACREMGFANNLERHLVRIIKNPVPVSYNRRLDCTGEESSITDCTLRCCYSCDNRQYLIGVVCESPFPINHWGGLVMAVQPHRSTLNFVNIENAGMAYINGSYNLVPAVFANKSAPTMNNLVVSKSAYDGIHLDHITDVINIQNVKVLDNFRHGLHVTTYIQQGAVSSVEATGNGGHGVLIDRRIEAEFTGNDFCKVTCVRCQHEPDEFPLKFRFYQSGGNLDCEKSFTTNGRNHVLAFWALSASNNVHISLRDGAYIDSPYIWQAEVERSHWSNPPPVILTTSNSIIIRLRKTYYRYAEHVNFVILSGTPESFAIQLSDINGQANGDSGVAVVGFQMPIHISSLLVQNNTDGLLLQHVSSDVKANNIVSTDNSRHGVSLQNIDGWFSLKQSTLERNKNDGLRYSFPGACHREAVQERYAINIFVMDSTFASNEEYGVIFDSACRMNISITRAYITENLIGAKMVHIYKQSDVLNLIKVENSTFSKNQKGLLVEGKSSLHATITGNTFSENRGNCLWMNALSDYSFVKQLSFRITFNTFQGNVANISSIVGVTVTKNRYNPGSTICNITDNTFSDNSVVLQEPYFVYTLQGSSAVLYLRAQTNINAQRNMFTNNKATFLLSLADKDPDLIINASYCYWGETNINYIAGSIWAHHHHYILPTAAYFPYLRSADSNDFDIDDPPYPNFIQGKNIGGIVRGDISILDNLTPYRVTSDIIILPEASLTVGKGITLIFEISTSMVIYGKLVASGSEEEKIVLQARQISVSHRIRLFNGTADNNGFLQIKDNDEWYNVCAENVYKDQGRRNFFCHAIGYQDAKSYSFKETTELGHEGLGAIACSDMRLSECKFSQPKLINCTNRAVLYLECSQNYWAGIHFAVGAKPSIMNHVDLKHTGIYSHSQKGRAAIHVDFMHHNFSNVNVSHQVNQKDVIGIKILKINQVLNAALSNIVVTTYLGHGLVLHDSRFKIAQSSIHSSSTGQKGLYVNPQMVELQTLRGEIIQSICFNTSIEMSDSDSLFVRVLDTEIAQNAKCELLLTAREGRNIAVQVVSGNVGTAKNCGKKTLFFHDGHKNYTEPEGVPVSRDGHVWVSSTNEVHLVMHRVYHYRYQCMNIVLFVSTVDDKINDTVEGVTIEDTGVLGFEYGIYLNDFVTPIRIKQGKVKGSKYGVYINQGIGSTDIVDTRIEKSVDRGLHFVYYRGDVNITNCDIYDNKIRGILVDYATHEKEALTLNIVQSNFTRNKVGFEFNKYSNRYTKRVHTTVLTVASSIFDKNMKDGSLYVGNENPYGKTDFFFTDNLLTESSMGIIYRGNRYFQGFKWVIERNLFQSLSGQVLHLKGSGRVTENIIRNCSLPNSHLIEISAVSVHVLVNMNEIGGNRGLSTVIYGPFQSQETAILDNEFYDNSVIDAILSLEIRHSGTNMVPLIANNTLISNRQQSVATAAALELKGTRQIVVQNNTFYNMNMTYEVRNNMKTSNASTFTDMQFNYWGSSSAEDIIVKINDGRRDKSCSLVAFIPFYTTDQKTVTFVDPFEPDIQKEGYRLSGRITSSIILNKDFKPYIIDGDLIVAPGAVLTITPGTVLHLLPYVSLMVHGSLNLQGTSHEPIILAVLKAETKINLRNGKGPNSGRIELLEYGAWRPICNHGWTSANAAVACRQMNLGPPTVSNRQFGYSTLPMQRVFRCRGDEISLVECHSYQLTRTCSRYNPVGVECSKTPNRFRVQFLSGNHEPSSVLQNVIITDIDRLEVSGVPPLFENVTITNTNKGIVFLGSGIANEKDVIMSDVKVKKSEDSGISLYDITSNVTFNRVVIEDTKRHGIYQAPSYDDKTNTHATDLYSTFRFCDASPAHYVRPGEEYKFFAAAAQKLTGCRRLLRTDERYSVHIMMKSYTTSYNSILAAQIYEGDTINNTRKITDFRTIRADRGSQTISINSQGNVMSILVHLAETAISYAVVKANPTRVNDCTFEEGMCGWHNYLDHLAVEFGNWTLHACNNGTQGTFGGLAADVTYPSGNEGHYIYVGSSHAKSCNVHQARASFSEDAALESSPFLLKDNICSVTFYHYRSIQHYYRAERLTLYGETRDKMIRLWSETLHNRYNRWERATVSLRKITATNYSLIFHVKYMKGCPNSVGIDDIKFIECPREKLVSTIKVSDSLLQRIPGRSIFFWNNDPEKHNVIWIEKVAIHDNKQTNDPAIGLKLKSAYVLIRNIDVNFVNSRGLDIEFSSITKERISEATLSQNSITYSRAGGAVFVANIGANNAFVWLTKNKLQHNSGTDKTSTVQVVNCSLIMNSNLLHKNTGRYILELGSQAVQNNLLQELNNNTFWFNAAQAPSAEYTISLNATIVAMTSNILNNPSNAFEISSRPTFALTHSLNCTDNWWGTGLAGVVDDKLRHGRNTQGLPEIKYKPFLEHPPHHFGLSASCPLGWRRRGWYCYIYNGGAVTYDQAVTHCHLQGALVMTSDSIDYDLVYDVTTYRDVDGSQKRASVWISLESNEIQPDGDKCNILIPENVNKSAAIVQVHSCIELHPFLCQKISIVLCRNGCFQHGICMGKTCLCDKGWDGEDCSINHCMDVNNCTGHGECVGPNVCKCKPGWMGRACSISYCARFDNCRSCARKTGCGWCDSSQSCLPGTGQNPDVHTCDTWFYYTCLTVDSSTSCSSQISTIGCTSRYCNINTTETDAGLCQQCKDIERCYDNNLNQQCSAWNESTCPKGAVVRDYEDPNRVENTVFKDNVHMVYPNETIIYFCPNKLSEDKNDKRNFFVANNRLHLRAGDIVISPQSGGVLHKVVYNTGKDGLDFLVALPAGLKDAILYADFKQSFDIQDIDDKVTREVFPDEDLLVDFISEDIEVDETVHVLQEDIPVYKCVGHLYDDGTEEKATTSYLVIPLFNFSADVQVGDVIVSNKTRGFLEDIVSIKSTSMGTFAETRLTRCPLGGSKEANLNLNIPRRDMACKGGDNWPGLVYWETSNELSKGQTVVGRSSGSVLDQVVRITRTPDYLYLEVTPVTAVDNGTAISKANLTDLHIRHRVRRSSTSANMFERFFKSLKFELGAGSHAWLKPSLSVSTRLSVVLIIKWNWKKLKFDYDAGMEFHGSMRAGVSAGLKIKGAAEWADGKQWYIKRPTSFFIPIGGIPVPCIWWVMGNPEWKASLSGEGEISGSFGGHVSFDVGAATAGLKKPPKKFDAGFNRQVAGKLKEGEAAFTFQFRPGVYARCPSTPWFLEREDPVDIEEPIPVSITGTIKIPVAGETDVKVSHRDEITTLEANLGFPFVIKIFAKACSGDCPDPDKPLQLAVTGGLSAVQVVISVVIVDVEFTWKTPGLMATKSFCTSQPVPCCICEDTGEAGKLDPKTKECLCECECDTPKGKVKSVKPEDGECKCDLCPDDTLQRFYEEIKCPCTCADGTTKEMESDETCDCSCDCADGSKDELDASGECPCECECKNCEQSTKGADGCICPNDRCPVCEGGAQPEWVDCECKCPDPECGIPPTCASGRRGENCDQPSCPSCQTCSGNGVCTAQSGSCASSCRCNPQWEGSCCERRRPRRTWGDPHLQTLDGVEFDYFGIGQFWDCISQENDFGYQVRYFYYKQTSFTGAVAVKAGSSVVTITTKNPTGSLDKPVLRVDGDLKPLDKPMKLTLSNSSVAVDIRPGKGLDTQKDDTALVLISMEFKTGATLTVDARHSPQMGRQYLNVLFTPTIPFLRKTTGICGVMDDDTSNDLTGPDQTAYNDTTEFVESWRILPISRNQGGLYGSWSWSDSNFHKDDTVDSSYTDPNYHPSYSISGFTPKQIKVATTLCSSLGLDGNLLDGCIYDVVITNDTTFADQETLKIGCPRQCSGKGRCVESQCVCLETWSGEDCSVGDCGVCYNGDCESGFCKCLVGWDGVDCSEKSTCHGVNNCTDPDHGVCDKKDKCLCHDGYTGQDCSLIATCYNRNNCSQNGVCVDFDVCKCNIAYKGDNCDQFSCQVLDFCSTNGICVAKDVCLCHPGWTGPSCAMPDCSSVDFCSDNGVCHAPSQCSCNTGYTGSNCSKLVECPELFSCHQNGLCVLEKKTADNGTKQEWSCRCFDDFYGEFCESAICDLVNNCTGHGRCVEPNLCQCDMGYKTENCGQYSCEILKRCSGHGECVAYDVCSCDEGWSGSACDIPDCADESDCNGQGVCLSPHSCECFEGFEGISCNETLGENTNVPVFNESVYEVTILENEKAGKTLVTVYATDDDSGKNGDIRFSLDPAGLTININSYLMVDSFTGHVVLLNSMPRTLAPVGNINITLVATDGGAPSLSTIALLRLYITDVNDHCPIFITPTPGEVLYLNASHKDRDALFTVTAEDGDFGDNANIIYGLSNDIDSSFFTIEPLSGLVYSAVDDLPVGEYRLTLLATDQAANPCGRELSMRIQIVPSELMPSTTPRPTTPITTPSSKPTTVGGPTSTSHEVITTEISSSSTGSKLDVSSTSNPLLSTESAETTKDNEQLTKDNEQVTRPTPTSKPHESDSSTVIIVGVVLGIVLVIAIIILIVLAVKLHSIQKRAHKEKASNFHEMQ